MAGPAGPGGAQLTATPSALSVLAGRAVQAGLAAGLDAVGIAGAEPFEETRVILQRRKEEGLSAGMQFTYRNPARSTDPSRILPGAAALVVGARGYLRTAPDPGTDADPDADADPKLGREPEPRQARPLGRVARYSWVDHYKPLREALGAVAGELRAAGWRAAVVADDNALVDRAAAHRAGLGWYGKNTLLLLPGAGSWYVLGSVVTDAPLPAEGAPVPDGCGSCSRCVAACPTGALDTPGALDARRCLAWLVQAPGTFPLEHREALGARLYGCDDCQEACPVNRLGARRHPPPPAEANATAAVDALDMLAAGDVELLAGLGRWYIPERDPAYLRRNALLVLGNVADPQHPDVRAAVTAALASPHPVVRGHAVWAARRLGFDDLAAAAAGDPDPTVAREADPQRPVARRVTI